MGSVFSLVSESDRMKGMLERWADQCYAMAEANRYEGVGEIEEGMSESLQELGEFLDPNHPRIFSKTLFGVFLVGVSCCVTLFVLLF